ncbi:hypothetical protein EDC04DRAFT_2742080, partial [Pisolithus marmoratus]
EEALYYCFFFFFCGFHLLFSMSWVIGIIPASSGFVQNTPMYTFDSWPGYVSGIIGAVTSTAMAVQVVVLAHYYRRIWRHHNAAGHTMVKAKAELARNGAKVYFTRG